MNELVDELKSLVNVYEALKVIKFYDLLNSKKLSWV